MSTTAQVALLTPRGQRDRAARIPTAARREAPLVRLAAFTALGAYGALRWSTLVTGGEARLRILGVLALGVILALGAILLLSRSRLLVVIATAVGAVAMLAVCGMPVSWIANVRLAVAVRTIGEGISLLPGLLVPYKGFDPWVRMVIVLGAGVLEFDAAAMLALTPRSAGGIRRVAPALPLLALAVIPSTIVHPRFAYLQGLLLFGLLAAFLWGERLTRQDSPAAVLMLSAVAAAAMILAPALNPNRPWLNYEQITANISAGAGERFDWSQGYGPIEWPRNDRVVFDVQAQRADYWKAESLDVFDGRGWSEGSLLVPGGPYAGISQSTLRRYSQTLTVTLRDITISQVIAAGVASPPVGLANTLLQGSSPGTWLSYSPLGPGDSYLVKVYDPQPSAAALASAGTSYPQSLLPGYLTLLIPTRVRTPAGGQQILAQQVFVPPFGSTPVAAYGSGSVDPASSLEASPYARAYALARRLLAASPTPYAYVTAVERYLSQGFRYDENPAPATYPLESFLFSTKAGYCQQFAGAMALLLRLGGIPARVAVGFTTGARDPATNRWVVTDIDAHAWVEAFFPGYGWVRFEPTPAADPALGGLLRGTNLKIPASELKLATGRRSHTGTAPHRRSRGARAGAGSGGVPAPFVVGAVLLTILLALGVALAHPPGGADERLAELVRAFARTGRPLSADTTLAAIELRLRSFPEAAGYVRALRLERYGGSGAVTPTGAQRRAVRRALRSGLGLAGRLRSLWALPPRRNASGARLNSKRWKTSTSSSRAGPSSSKRGTTTRRRFR